MEERPVRLWRNKRKKSLYNEEGHGGFIFKKIPKAELPQKQETTASIDPTDLQTSALVCEGKHVDEGDQSLDGLIPEGGESDIAIMRDVEIKRFIAALRKELTTSSVEESENNLDDALECLAEDLRGSEIYFNYLDAAEELPSGPLAQEMKETISALKVKIDMCERELREWDEVVETKNTEFDQAASDLESQRGVQFLHLRPEDEEALKSHLSPEQMELVALGHGFDSEFVQQATKELERINSEVDRELQAIREYCQSMANRTKSDNLAHAEISMVEETPRTLFKALKNHM